jgi:hypothetical protein
MALHRKALVGRADLAGDLRVLGIGDVDDEHARMGVVREAVGAASDVEEVVIHRRRGVHAARE